MVRRRGQVALYLLMTIVAIFLLALLNVDTFLSVRTKNRLQNGGDAAALAAAREQAQLINEIGELTIQHIKTAAVANQQGCDDIERQQRKLLLLGPVEALREANAAARRNGLPTVSGYRDTLLEHAAVVRSLYAGGDGGPEDPYPPSYPGAWQDYAAAIENVAAGGVAAMPMSLQYYCGPGQHTILNPQFYKAIAGRDWCWFYFTNEQLLHNYTSFHDWPEITEIPMNSTENSEIFSLNLKVKTLPIASIFSFDQIRALANLPENAITPEGTNMLKQAQEWVFFDESYWRQWSNGRTFYTGGETRELPVVGSVREPYNIYGCWAACATHKSMKSITTDETHSYSWSAVAKPFGSLDGELVTSKKYLVMPCMDEVRLVPTDAVSTADSTNVANPDWALHRRKHIEKYLQGGPGAVSYACWFCQQLKRWESESFRRSGVIWLKYHSKECIRPVSGGASKTGGTTHAH